MDFLETITKNPFKTFLFILIIFITIGIIYMLFKKNKKDTDTKTTSNVLTCKLGEGYLDSNKTSCVVCNSGNKHVDISDVCVTCSGTKPYFDIRKLSCVDTCVNGVIFNDTCVAGCIAPLPYNSNGTCVAKCPNTLPYNNNGTCTSCMSPLPYNSDGTCVAKCPHDAYNHYNNKCFNETVKDAIFSFIIDNKTLTKNNNDVSLIFDEKSSYTLQQDNSLYMPLYIPNMLNNKPCIQFTQNTFLSLSNNIPSMSEFTLFFIASFKNNGDFLTLENTSTNNNIKIFFNRGHLCFNIKDLTIEDSGTIYRETDGFFIQAITFSFLPNNKLSIQTYKNGKKNVDTLETIQFPSALFNNMFIGSKTNNGYSGYFFALMLTDYIISEDLRQLMESTMSYNLKIKIQ